LYSKYLTNKFFSLNKFIFLKIPINIDRMKIEKIEKYKIGYK
jgi:hypothetical protein